MERRALRNEESTVPGPSDQFRSVPREKNRSLILDLGLPRGGILKRNQRKRPVKVRKKKQGSQAAKCIKQPPSQGSSAKWERSKNTAPGGPAAERVPGNTWECIEEGRELKATTKKESSPNEKTAPPEK